MPKKKYNNYDNTLFGRYIRQIENPDSIGWDSSSRIWRQSTRKGDDERNRGMGIDVLNNKAAKKLTQGRVGGFLTEEEERQLRNEYLQEMLNVIDRQKAKHPGLNNMSPRKQAEVIGALYRGDAPKLWDKSTILGKALESPNEEDFHRAIDTYYNSIGLGERARNNDKFWSNQTHSNQSPHVPSPTITRQIDGMVFPTMPSSQPTITKQDVVDAAMLGPKAVAAGIGTVASYINQAVQKYVKPKENKDDKTVRWAEGGFLKPKDAWDALSMKNKADMIGIAVKHGITTLSDIREKYNEFAEGGNTEEPWTMQDEANYRQWRDSLPDNLRDTNDDDYDMRGAFKAGMQPILESDGKYHLQSRDPKTGRILKAPHHPTFLQAIATDASMGYYPLTDNKGQTYTQTWRGNEYSFGGPLIEGAMNEYRDGGGIHIKPSHRGRLTELKKRTGKSEAELYNDDNPAHKKMVVFARNARKWKHGDGGNLYGGNNKNGQQMQLGLKVTNGWQPYSLEQVLDFAAINEANKVIQEAAIARRVNDYLTTSNDATAVADGRLQNQHLTERAIEGAKAHRAWEEEHPVMNTIGNVLGATPLAVAAIPVVGAAVESAPAIASALAPGSAFWVNPVTQQVAASTLGGEAVNLATKVATPYDSWGEGVSDVVNQTIGWNPQETWWGSTLADMTNPGYWTPYGAVESGTAKAIEGVSPINRAVKNTVDNIERRGIETFMRTTPFANPIPEAKNGFLSMWNGQQGGRQRLAHIADYVLTGRKVGPKGYYNSFADFQPTNLAEMVKEPTFAERWEAFKNPTGISHGYSGFVDVNGMVPVMQERPDMIDAFLYGKTIDSSFGVRRLSIGDNFGPHTQYVAEKYASKAHDIPVYEVATPDGIDVATPVGDWKGVDKGLFDTGTGDFLNVAGHIGTKGTTADGTSVIQRQDIWKFNPDEYFNRWLQNTRPYEEMSPRLKKAAQWGLKEVDRLGTPVITRTKWDKWGWL